MDPVSAAGLALGVASLGLQVYTGCIQGIQLLVTALGYEDDCKHLNLRLRLEQQRLFAWSETSGLLDVNSENQERILNSNVFHLHRQTVLDLLVQVQCLFDEFIAYQGKHSNLTPVRDDGEFLVSPELDAKQASFPISEKKRLFIKKAMMSLKQKSQEGLKRFKWVSFDKEGFEQLLAKFTLLNDTMMNILDHSLQIEIRHTVQDTNRGVLLLHHKIADLSHLVLALKDQLEIRNLPGGAPSRTRLSNIEREANVAELKQLSRLAKFKAYNETIDPKSDSPAPAVDDAVAGFLELAKPGEQRLVQLPKYLIELDPSTDETEDPRCEAILKTAEGKKRVWIEWKDYDNAGNTGCLSKAEIVDRVRKLACLLHHSPKPEAFRTPHCIGFFDKADPDVPEEDVDILDRRLGLIFERPDSADVHDTLPPVSLRELLLDTAVRKPRVTDRIKLAHALSNCLLYLHAVNWLHKGLRSHNILFFKTRTGHVDYGQAYLSGFDFSRPGGSEEVTEMPGFDAEHDLYRHPRAQSNQGRLRERSKKSFDIYSLGVILVELAHWKPVDGVLGIEMRLAKGQSDVVRQVRGDLLRSERVADLGAEMGEKFEEATRRCLVGERELGLEPGDDETADEVASRLSGSYYDDVVKKLAEIVV
ncbi:prion-inhibition and propagation domain-containing protein [Trichoderma austrokoningii]